MKNLAAIFLFLFSFGVLIAQEKCDSIQAIGVNPEQGVITVCPCPDIGCRVTTFYFDYMNGNIVDGWLIVYLKKEIYDVGSFKAMANEIIASIPKNRTPDTNDDLFFTSIEKWMNAMYSVHSISGIEDINEYSKWFIVELSTHIDIWHKYNEYRKRQPVSSMYKPFSYHTYSSKCDECIDTAYKDRGTMSISRRFSGNKIEGVKIKGQNSLMRIESDGLWFNEVLISSDTAILEFMNGLLFKI